MKVNIKKSIGSINVGFAVYIYEADINITIWSLFIDEKHGEKFIGRNNFH